MTVELIAARFLARYVGQSLYTWTAVIGVILAGISVGNLFGGYSADRAQRRPLVSLMLLLSSITTLAVLFQAHLIGAELRACDKITD
jgi:predicted MFS family arabinose efflux permease